VNGGQFEVTATSGNTDVGGDLQVDGTTSLFSALTEDADIAVAGDKFQITANTGATSIKGSLTVNSNSRVSIDADPTLGASTITGDVTFKAGSGSDTFVVDSSSKFRVAPSTGVVTVAGDTTVGGNLDVGGDGFTVNTDGNAAVKGSLTVGGAALITGATVLESATTVEGNLVVGADKFTVDASSGETEMDGNVAVTGDITVNGDNLIIGTSKSPSSASDTCTQGHIAWDNGFLYVCVQTDTWKRASMAAL